MKYLYLTPIEENPFERRVAELAASEAAQVLKIPKPDVRFFRRYPFDDFGDLGREQFRHPNENLLGFALSLGIGIRTGLYELELAQTVVHECRHVWQARTAIWRNRSSDAREADASQFEHEWPR